MLVMALLLSHLLEHMRRNEVTVFLMECYRVLKMNGIVRVVVPDLENIINRYIAAISRLKDGDNSASILHERAIHDLFDQMVRNEPAGRRRQSTLVRFLEKIVRGNASNTGELHRWMYDRYSLKGLLSGVGFKDIQQRSPNESKIDRWNTFKLDINDDGTIYKPGSLYMEASK